MHKVASYIINNSYTDVTRLVAGRLLHEAMHINENYIHTIHASYPRLSNSYIATVHEASFQKII